MFPTKLNAALILALFVGCQSLSSTQVSRRNLLKSTVASGVASFVVGVSDASAYPRRDVGDPATRSASTAAMNDQAFKTNNRLEQQGFKLDTFEEEQARLSSAMASFSYDDATSKKKKSGSKKGSDSKK